MDYCFHYIAFAHNIAWHFFNQERPLILYIKSNDTIISIPMYILLWTELHQFSYLLFLTLI